MCFRQTKTRKRNSETTPPRGSSTKFPLLIGTKQNFRYATLILYFLTYCVAQDGGPMHKMGQGSSPGVISFRSSVSLSRCPRTFRLRAVSFRWNNWTRVIPRIEITDVICAISDRTRCVKIRRLCLRRWKVKISAPATFYATRANFPKVKFRRCGPISNGNFQFLLLHNRDDIPHRSPHGKFHENPWFFFPFRILGAQSFFFGVLRSTHTRGASTRSHIAFVRTVTRTHRPLYIYVCVVCVSRCGKGRGRLHDATLLPVTQ